ncbi:DCC1-like thiol-disulfide oxidoreductase family protein [Pendulispora rubella]|uniref:DCC1-like thiol-disulfide oxidoreductase family protein n=1 Tax=Pendulispora rubella TaxID=2741070 RepID=A0ABZ2KYU8_9BACT
MTESELPPRIVLFDGVCGLCDALIQWFVRVDRARALRYAPIQGETAARLRAMHPEIPSGVDTVIFVDEGTVHLRSRGILVSMRYLPPPWRWARFLRWIPLALSDAAYRLVARFRYRIFGKREACRVPGPEERALFLP